MKASPRAPKLISVGEVLWDLFPQSAKFGGAPANLGAHAAALGCNVTVISRLGADELGAKARAFLQDRQLDTTYLQTDPSAPTGTVLVSLDADGTPTYEILQHVAWDRLEWNSDLREVAGQADAVCFGTLGQRAVTAAATIQQLLDATPRTAWKLLDLNVRPPFCEESVIQRSLEAANALKLNDAELKLLGDFLPLPSDPKAAVSALRHQFELRLVALTRGGDGSTIWLDDEESDLGPRNPGAIVDTVGAGDSFTATLVSGLLHHIPLPEVHEVAAQVAAFVCTQPGAVPRLPAEFRSWASKN